MGTPAEMPNPLPVNVKTFDASVLQNVTPVQGGFIQTVDRMTPFWIAKYATPPLTAARDQAFQAFLDGLRGAVNTFLGFDPRRPKPYNYRTYAYGVKPWEASSGSTYVYAASPSASTVTVYGLAVGAVLTAGDYVCWKQTPNNMWYCHRITANATADGSGHATLSVYPPPITVSAGSNFARFERAGAEMKIIGPIVKSDRLEDTGPVYSFTAVQFIDRT